ncbi:MAG: aminomethyltransferase family protein [Planctomycetes bacterium]|nr:aminomethyltransferase family protein [Planctomycetota bacterium]
MPASAGSRLRSPLHDRHVAGGAEMAADDGWEMPRRYDDPAAEARAAHGRAVLFDISHVGRIRIRGDEAPDLLERLCTTDAARQEDDTAAWTLLLNRDGGIVDLVLLARLQDDWLLACSPSRRAAVIEHLLDHAGGLDVKIDDRTPKTAMVQLTGPAGGSILDAVLPQRASDLPEGAAATGSVFLAGYTVIRAGLTSLWSLQVVLPNMLAGRAWDFMTGGAGPSAVPPAGEEAREILRIEAGLCRWGRELDERTDPIAAGLAGMVDFGHDFIGAEAVRRILRDGPRRRLIGLLAGGAEAGGAAPRTEAGRAVQAGWTVLLPAGRAVGEVTSAAFSPAAGATVALAYVAADAEADEGDELILAGPAERIAAQVRRTRR